MQIRQSIEAAHSVRRHSTGNRLSHRWLLWATLLVVGVIAPPQPAEAGLLSISPEKERRMGEEAAREIESHMPVVSGPVADWVQTVGQRLAAVSNPEFKYSFKVIQGKEINAFALPGGYIYVFTGLRKVAPTDDELAAVIAHEITHAEEHHFARQYGKSQKRGLILGIGSALLGLPNLAQQVIGIVDFSMTQRYSRAHETESDRLGMQRMVRAGFNPQGMVTLLENLAKDSSKSNVLDKWFGSHPESKKRVGAARNYVLEVKSLQAQNNPLVRPIFQPWRSEDLGGAMSTQGTIAPAGKGTSDTPKQQAS